MFQILELIPMLEKEISKRVHGHVMVMLDGFERGIHIRIKNNDNVFGYKTNTDCLHDGSIAILLDDVMYRYKTEILKKYFKEVGGIE